MQNHTISRKTPNKKSRQVGRGGTRGKTSGKGTKGQNARAGRKKRPEIRDTIKRLPKLRGLGKNSNKTIQSKPVSINLDSLKSFKSGDVVSPETLIKNKIIKTIAGARPIVKVLGNGEISTSLTFKSCLVSSGARSKIEAASGVIE